MHSNSIYIRATHCFYQRLTSHTCVSVATYYRICFSMITFDNFSWQYNTKLLKHFNGIKRMIFISYFITRWYYPFYILLHSYIVSRVVINPLGNVEYETRCIQSNFTSSSPIKTKSNKQRHFFAGEEYLVWLCKICFCWKVLEVYSRVKSFVTFCVEGDNLKHKTHTKPNNQFSFKLKQIPSKIKKCHKFFSW